MIVFQKYACKIFIFFYKERYKIQEILFFRTADIQILQKTYISQFDKFIHTGCWGSGVCAITGINDSEKKKRLVIMHVIKKRNTFAFGREEGLGSAGARQHLRGEEWREDRCWIPRKAGGTWKTDLKENRSLTKILREFIVECLILNLSYLYLMKLPVSSTFLFTPVRNKYIQEAGRENWEEHSLRFMTVIRESLQCLFTP